MHDNVPTYMTKAEEMLVAEGARVQAVMAERTSDSLLRVLENTVLVDQLPRLMDNEASGLRVLLREDKREDLGRAYRLFSRIDGGLPPIARLVREHFQEMGLGIVRERESGSAAGESP